MIYFIDILQNFPHTYHSCPQAGCGGLGDFVLRPAHIRAVRDSRLCPPAPLPPSEPSASKTLQRVQTDTFSPSLKQISNRNRSWWRKTLSFTTRITILFGHKLNTKRSRFNSKGGHSNFLFFSLFRFTNFLSFDSVPGCVRIDKFKLFPVCPEIFFFLKVF